MTDSEKLDLILEKIEECNRNILIKKIAENEAKPSNALELLMVQVNILESKVRDLEQKISA